MANDAGSLFFIFAGETSGDLHGSHLIPSLMETCLKNRCMGVGGPKMRELPFNCTIPMENFQVMGFSDVFSALPRLIKLFYQVLNEILTKQPDYVILIDYPGFNLRLAKALRKKGYKGKIIQFICPSVWAHGKKRIDTLKKNYDLLLTIFPFETSFFTESPTAVSKEACNNNLNDLTMQKLPRLDDRKWANIKSIWAHLRSFNPGALAQSNHLNYYCMLPKLKVKYIGNPLAFSLNQYSYDTDWKKKKGISEDKVLMALFPGSRPSEIKNHLHQQLALAQSLKQKHTHLHFALSCAQEYFKETFLSAIERYSLILNEDIHIIDPTDHYHLMKHSGLALAKSGTVTLELALHCIPTIVHYELSSLNYLLAKYIIRVNLPYYCIVNILENRMIFPEFIGKNLDIQKIEQGLDNLISHSECYNAIKRNCYQLKENLGLFPSYKLAAKEILEL